MYPVPDDRAVQMGLDVDGSELIPHNGKGGVRAAAEGDKNEQGDGRRAGFHL